MNKKVLFIILAVLIVAMGVAFSGCGNSAPAAGGDNSQATPAAGGDSSAAAPTDSGNGGSAGTTASDGDFDAYMAAANALNGADNVTMDINSTTNMKVAGQEVDTTMAGTAQMIRSNGSLQLQMDMTTTAVGQDIPMIVYYKDGYTYINMMNGAMKMKVAQSEEEMLSTENIGVQVFDKQYVKDIKSTSTADGVQYTFTIDGKGMNALVQNAEKNMSSSTATEVTDASMSFGDATIIANIDKSGAIINEDITMSFTMKAADQDITADIHSTVGNIKMGAAVIAFPSDLDSYTETPAAS